MRWLNSQRLALASRLLETTDRPVESVAVDSGFGSAVSLRQHFGAAYGVSPITWPAPVQDRGLNARGGRLHDSAANTAAMPPDLPALSKLPNILSPGAADQPGKCWRTKGKQMNKSMIKGMAVGGLAMVVLGAGAVTGFQKLGKPKVAEVVAVKEVMKTVVTPHERCDNVQVQHQAPVQDTKRIAGTAIGGLAGGLLGSQIGGGNGKTIATIAGAAAGGYAGNRVQKDMQSKDVVTSSERRCRTVNEKSQQVAGYKVTYRLDGKDGVVQTSFRPGATLPVKNGRVVTTPPDSRS